MRYRGRERLRGRETKRERGIRRERGRERLRGREAKLEVSFFLLPLNCDGTFFELSFFSIFRLPQKGIECYRRGL